ncbi:MAG: hypothetical protein WKF50_14240 [Nocardioides sp.]
MTLRDAGGFYRWVETESPSAEAWSVVRTFLARVGDRPWAAPSVPVEEMSNQPDYEVRTAIIEVGEGVEVHAWWLHEYATGAVDIIGVTFR